jgi:anti-sigma B factor antagonist
MVLASAGREPMSLTENSAGQEVTVRGRLDVDSVAEVRAALHEILGRGGGDLLVHLAQAEVYDATALGVIVGVHHRARRLGRRLVLVDVSPRLDRLLRSSRLHRVLARGPGAGESTPAPSGPAVADFPPEPGACTEISPEYIQTLSPMPETVSPPTA